MSTTHSAVLANIDVESGTRATVLAERASVTKQAIGEVVSDLEAKGLVNRVTDPEDGRAKLIQLTAEGHRLMAAAFDVIGEIEGALLDKVGTKNVETTKHTLSALIEILNAKRAR
ncbi:MAG TPA: MarR family transcriptional regulator [Actinomycetota bacterium]|nr:MarR family transcriptional regulator [Actinomycetota bacterium]